MTTNRTSPIVIIYGDRVLTNDGLAVIEAIAKRHRPLQLLELRRPRNWRCAIHVWDALRFVLSMLVAEIQRSLISLGCNVSTR